MAFFMLLTPFLHFLSCYISQQVVGKVGKALSKPFPAGIVETLDITL